VNQANQVHQALQVNQGLLVLKAKWASQDEMVKSALLGQQVHPGIPDQLVNRDRLDHPVKRYYKTNFNFHWM